MRPVHLSKATALSTGSDLWVLPEAEACRWTTLIDWYLNLQINRSKNWVSTHRNSQDQEPNPNPSALLPSPLLIVTQSLIPCQLVLQFDFSNDLPTWIQQISNHWKKLDTLSLRVFLPGGISAQQFQKNWPPFKPHQNVTFVLEDGQQDS